MLISLNWLKDFVQLPKNLDPKDLANQLTLKTAEVEQVKSQGAQFDKMVTGQVIELQKHPDADKLKVAKVNIGEKEHLQIVCGGANLKEGQYVAVTLPGAMVRWHGEGEPVEVKETKIRGVQSTGMIAASSEIGLENPNEGPQDILDLSATKPTPGTPLAEIFAQNADTVLEFDNKSLTHRPDLWGHYGIAREVAAITKTKFKPLNPTPPIPTKGETVDVKVEDPELCPRFCALVINNIKVEDSPDWLKKRLQAAGHGVHNNIVDVTNYVMAEIGQPMHAFDKTNVNTGLIIRTAKKGEILKGLDGKDYKLDETVGLVCDHKGPSSIAGIFGGEGSGINNQTTTIILEAANWHPSRLRRTSTKLGLRTDAVQRFEKSLDPHLPELAIKRAAEIILQICPTAEIAGPITDIHDPKVLSKKITIELNTEKAASKIGVPIPAKQMKEILESLEFAVAGTAPNFKVTVPTHRASKDVSIEDDLIEEVARMYGYDNIEPSLPSLPTRLPEENYERFKKHRARELFSYGLGYNEVKNYSFYGAHDLKNANLQEDQHLKVLNYLSEDQTHMRTSPVPGLLKNITLNIKNLDAFKIYEIGHVYKEIGQFMPLEEKFLAGAVVEKATPQAKTFVHAKGAVEAFLKKFNLPVKTAKGVEATPTAHPQKALTYLAPSGATLAKVYILHPQVQKNYDLTNQEISIFEINLSQAFSHSPEPRKFQPLPKFPSIKMDVSVVISATTEVQKLQNAILQADQKLIASCDLFDIYQGEHLPKDKKAVAFAITLSAPDRTLTDEEMTETQSKIFKNLEALGGTIRGK